MGLAKKSFSVALACLLLSFVFFFFPFGSVHADAAPQPNQSVRTSTGVAKGYNLATLRKMPGITFVKATIKGPKSHPVSPNSVTSSGSYLLTTTAIITWTFWYGHFLCGFGSAGAEANPWTADVHEFGDLYVNGNWKGGTDTGDWTSTWGETGCWNYGSNTLWEMDASGAASWWYGGPQLSQNTWVWGYQP